MVDARYFVDCATAPLFVGTVKLCNTIFYFCTHYFHNSLPFAGEILALTTFATHFCNSLLLQLTAFCWQNPKFSLTMMPSEMATCPGCNNHFTLQDYQSHLALSWDLLCHAVFKNANDTYEHLMNHIEENSSAVSDIEAVLFQGDTFEMAEDYDPPALMEVSDDEDNGKEMTNMVA